MAEELGLGSWPSQVLVQWVFREKTTPISKVYPLFFPSLSFQAPRPSENKKCLAHLWYPANFAILCQTSLLPDSKSSPHYIQLLRGTCLGNPWVIFERQEHQRTFGSFLAGRPMVLPGADVWLGALKKKIPNRNRLNDQNWWKNLGLTGTVCANSIASRTDCVQSPNVQLLTDTP